MTDNQEPESRMEAAFRQALERHAGQAPTAEKLLGHVRARRSRSRRGWWAAGTATVAASATVVVLLVVNGVFQAQPPAGGQPDDEVLAVQDKWRSESYQGIEVRVPDDWRYGTTGEPPCLEDGGKPYVGRPGAVLDIGCTEPVPELAKRVPYLWFDSPERPGVVERDHGWVEETRQVGGVRITVFTDDDQLRKRILDSARTVDDTDSSGCPLQHPNARNPAARPSGSGLDDIGQVESVSRCTYTLAERGGSDQVPLVAASTLAGARAREVVDAVRAAPRGSGPNATSGSCIEQYGDEIMVLIVHGSKRDQDVIVRYDGCFHHGFDDADVERELTRDGLEPLLTGVHFPTTFDGSISGLLGHPTGGK